MTASELTGVPADQAPAKGARWLGKLRPWRTSWSLSAMVCGMFGGPGMYLLVYAWVADDTFFSPLVFGFVGLVMAAVSFAALCADGVRIGRWSRAESRRRSAAVYAIGAVLWLLPGSWTIPQSVLDFPFDWLLLSIPFPLAAVAVSPAPVSHRRRNTAAGALAVVAVLWPVACGLAAAEARRQAGVSKDGWFALHIDGYSASVSRSAERGDLVVYYSKENDSLLSGADMVLESWPATTALPCDHFSEPSSLTPGAVCSAEHDGTWSVTDPNDAGLVGILARRGDRYLEVEVWTTSDDPIDPARLPALLAAAHVAGDHEVLAAANGAA